jgi:hypothetical protein
MFEGMAQSLMESRTGAEINCQSGADFGKLIARDAAVTKPLPIHAAK